MKVTKYSKLSRIALVHYYMDIFVKHNNHNAI